MNFLGKSNFNICKRQLKSIAKYTGYHGSERRGNAVMDREECGLLGVCQLLVGQKLNGANFSVADRLQSIERQ